jgi:hypothetical protein
MHIYLNIAAHGKLLEKFQNYAKKPFRTVFARGSVFEKMWGPTLEKEGCLIPIGQWQPIVTSHLGNVE